MEADYAKALRKLVKNYTVKEKHRGEDESTQARGFRWVVSAMILPGYQTSDSAISSKIHPLALLALLVALVLQWGDSADLNFAIL